MAVLKQICKFFDTSSFEKCGLSSFTLDSELPFMMHLYPVECSRCDALSVKVELEKAIVSTWFSLIALTEASTHIQLPTILRDYMYSFLSTTALVDLWIILFLITYSQHQLPAMLEI